MRSINETEDIGNENLTTGKKELSKVNKAATEQRQVLKNMLKIWKDKEMAAKLSTESQLLQISRDDLDFLKSLWPYFSLFYLVTSKTIMQMI